MPTWDTVTIVGVGLIGGSIGLALQRRKLARQVVGVGRRNSSLQKARQCGTVTATTTSLRKGVKEARLMVICTPVEQIAEHALEAAAHCPEGALITDAGSTKQAVVEAVMKSLPERARFVGSHPLAGSEKAGPQNAQADLFEGRTVVMTPVKENHAEELAETERFWESLGARVIRQTPAAHDQAVATTSHLTHLIASSLAAATPRSELPLVASGWLDTTRVAAGDVELWRQILSDNRHHVLKSLTGFEKLLGQFRTALENNDQNTLRKLLETGKQHRDSVGS